MQFIDLPNLTNVVHPQIKVVTLTTAYKTQEWGIYASICIYENIAMTGKYI